VSNAGDDAVADTMAVDTVGTPARDDAAETKIAALGEPAQRWFAHPVTDNNTGVKEIDPNEPESRHLYRLWGNGPIYCFVRMLLTLYERLERLKLAEDDCRETVRNAKKHKPANELGIMDKLPQEFFADTSASANYYNQMLQKFISVLDGEIDFSNDGVEECLRRFYLQSGYPMYAFEKIVQALARYGSQIVTQEGPNKDRSWEILQLWRKDRAKDTVDPAQRVDYKKAAEKLIGNGDTYRIEWVS
jgi:paired amphipathic helix protein Sin3a